MANNRGVAQERNEKHPAWNGYHYAGNTSNSSTRIVFDTNINALIHRRTLHFRTGRDFFFLPRLVETNSLELRNIGNSVQYYIVEAGS